jgi:hypothetical protein
LASLCSASQCLGCGTFAPARTGSTSTRSRGSAIGSAHRRCTDRESWHASRATATRSKSYEFHEEAKCADNGGAPCGKQSVGLLRRRHVRIERPPRLIGKESNKLEEVAEGSAADAGDVYTEYPDLWRDERASEILPLVRSIPLPELIERSGLLRRALQMIRSGRRPNPENQRRLCDGLNSVVGVRRWAKTRAKDLWGGPS